MQPYTKSKESGPILMTERVVKVCGPLLEWVGATQTFDIELKFQTELKDSQEEEGFSAMIERRYPYRRLVIIFSGEKFYEQSDDELRVLLLHEIMHEMLAGDFLRAMVKELDALELSKADRESVDERMTEESEDLVDRLAIYMERALRETKGMPGADIDTSPEEE